ncbi:acyl-CoA dehydrogenase family protein [Mycobacterium sp. 1274756.6]|uniref:acyl-CoA dehydrogenase family protein n=1 Tax=Mycobacterium sp. 1274756.6 TaxID=1834076 RepID=UPI0008004774|nr:acyl-CoA dehydrogenase family protein [Mycobacterium sp. 1274756.6]OBJ70674.1 acyl-CoA dehydrogenase [Mycobacterium sp. 1274756.6]
MQRNIFETEHEAFRSTVREFIVREVSPYYPAWEETGSIDRRVFEVGAKTGIYGLAIPEEYGGAGVRDNRYRMVVAEELARARATALSVSFANQDDMVICYLAGLGTDVQKSEWLPKLATGSVIGAVAMTEPDAGSDLRGMRTTAVADGEGWVLNGQKTFITHGHSADLVIVAAKTPKPDGSGGISLFLVPTSTPGFKRGRVLQKVGLRAQDTSELFFENMWLPADALLGEEDRGMRQLMTYLPEERLLASVIAVADARAVYDLTAAYCFERKAFGQFIGDFQATRFSLAEMETEIDLAQHFIDCQVMASNSGELSSIDAAKGKWWTTELQKRVVDKCVQLHGGYGYILEYAVARAYLDMRIQTIYGGTTEIMKEIVGRDIAARHAAH